MQNSNDEKKKQFNFWLLIQPSYNLLYTHQGPNSVVKSREKLYSNMY